jgi:hypothetical protein
MLAVREGQMPDLNDVEKRIAELKAEIEPTVKEIAALEDLARGLKALERGERLTRPPVRDFKDLTMPEAAAQVLLESRDKAVHYTQVTMVALQRGFRGKRTDMSAPTESIAASFRRMMSQDKKVFVQEGRGMFRLTKEFLDHNQ